jgi:magnesium chelatase family protein
MLGLDAHAVTIECHIRSGLPGTTIVGLPEGAVRESRDRVKSAMTNCGFDYPGGKVVINLAPGHISKTGTALDLPIALGILAASRQVPDEHLTKFEFLGELGLFGELRPVRGALGCALAARRHGRVLVVPAANASEAAIAPTGSIAIACDLAEVVRLLRDPESQRTLTPPPASRQSERRSSTFDAVIGQTAAKRALMLAAAGGHHLIMVGPPGTGKTMLARSFAELLPDLGQAAAMEVAAVYSAAGQDRDDYARVPFRDPHHSASAAALIGGGSPPAPGEIALAHHGVLFLDELPHFKPAALNSLREPIETGQAVIARAEHTVRFPCRFQLIAAMNPCPSGRSCREDACRCTPNQVRRYQARVSGPLLDRIDLHVSVPELSEEALTAFGKARLNPSDPDPRQVVAEARARQWSRQHGLNDSLDAKTLEREMRAAQIEPAFLREAITTYRLSARSFHKLWRVARTIADLEGAEKIGRAHFAEAVSYRAIDWERGA